MPSAVPTAGIEIADMNEDGKLEKRIVSLHAGRLEVCGPGGERMHTYSRREISGAYVRETGGGAWLVIEMAGAGDCRIAMAALSGVKDLQSLADQIGKWADRQSPETQGEPASSAADAGGPNAAMSWSKRMKVLTGLMKYSWPFRKSIGISVGALLLASLLGSLPPYFVKMIIDGGLLASSETRFLGLIGALLLVHLLVAGFEVLRTSIGIRIGNLMMSRIRQEMFDKLMKLSVRYYDQRKTAPFIGRIQYDTSYVEAFLSEAIPNILAQLVMIAAVVALLFALDWHSAAVLTGCFPLCALVVRYLWPKMRSLTVRTWNAEFSLQQYIAETLQGIRIIKAFRQEKTEGRRFRQWNEVAVSRAAEQLRWSQWLQPGLNLGVSWAIVFVWFDGGRRVIRGETSLGTIVAFTSYLSMFLSQLRWTFKSAGWANRAIASADRILDLLHTREDLPEAGEPVPLKRARGDIRLHSVTFGYDAGGEVLKNISLHIRPGEKIGITGRSGAGKSTLIHLLCRFYDPVAGSVAIDGIDLRRLSAEDLGRQIGVVLQDTYLFDGTIAQNIAYGRPDATMEEMMEAALSANAHSFISRLPFGYDTRIGERGVRLSGGEKQRISIARTLLLNPPILILDEATASMDAGTEREIQDALDTLCRGRTTVAIAHRLSTLRSVDRILVLDQGRIAESGTHEELERRQGIYHQLLQANRLSAVAPQEAAG